MREVPLTSPIPVQIEDKEPTLLEQCSMQSFDSPSSSFDGSVCSDARTTSDPQRLRRENLY